MIRLTVFFILFSFFMSDNILGNVNTTQEESLLCSIDYSNVWLTRQDDIIGFIGDNYQRFYIRFLSIIQDESDKSLYAVMGKTKVNNTICNFTGSIRIKEIEIIKEQPLRKARVRAEYHLEEDSLQKHSGFFKGSLTSHIYWENGSVFLDDLRWELNDSYCNNQFEGKWINYRTKIAKKCNWGIGRIPDSEELDIGAGEFSPNLQFEQNGWSTYPDGAKSNPPYEEQLKIDRKQWW